MRASRDAAEVPGAVSDYLAQQNLPQEAAIAPHPELQAIPWSERPLLRLRAGRAEASDLVAIQHGYAGIAETGTLMLPSAPERPTTLNLLAETAIVVLRASRIVGAYEEAWDLLRAEAKPQPSGGFMPRNVMLVTGPSRSADIESDPRARRARAAAAACRAARGRRRTRSRRGGLMCAARVD